VKGRFDAKEWEMRNCCMANQEKQKNNDL